MRKIVKNSANSNIRRICGDKSLEKSVYDNTTEFQRAVFKDKKEDFLSGVQYDGRILLASKGADRVE